CRRRWAAREHECSQHERGVDAVSTRAELDRIIGGTLADRELEHRRTAEGLLVAYRGALADRGSAPLAAAVGGS
ncbi:MAG TPA: hypothetical protein VNC85_08225, partial [Mycobacteriales bacterium]|nr:hypothetical protein [Mycobacteriales bacterium]